MRKLSLLQLLLVLAVTANLVICAAYGKPDQRNLNHSLFAAVESNNLAKAKSLLSQGASVDARGTDGRTVLMEASSVGDPEKELLRVHPPSFIKLLLARGANVNLEDKNGNTALMTAAQGSIQAVKLLIAKGAEVNSQNNRGETALMRAIDWECEGSCSSPAVVQYLLSRGAKVNATDNDGNTPLIVASRLPYYATADAKIIVEMLLAKGANVNARTKNGNTALKWAKVNGHSVVLRALKRAGARE